MFRFPPLAEIAMFTDPTQCMGNADQNLASKDTQAKQIKTNKQTKNQQQNDSVQNDRDRSTSFLSFLSKLF